MKLHYMYSVGLDMHVMRWESVWRKYEIKRKLAYET